ncbi:MAG: chemotaxis protein CheW [Gammaproteobacteria bacterium]|jgi:chemosensory pili system protein ChpC
MNEQELLVRSQLIPLHNMRMVLPNTAIAEVISYYKPQSMEGMPPWFIGRFVWRGLQIPLISLETAALDQAPETGRRSRIIVLNTLTGSNQIPFYGIISQGIPRLMGLDHTTILDAPNAQEGQKFVLRQVLVEGHPAVIPDLNAMEGEMAALGVTVIQEHSQVVG